MRIGVPRKLCIWGWLGGMPYESGWLAMSGIRRDFPSRISMPSTPCPRGGGPIASRSSVVTPWVTNSTRCSPSGPRTPRAPYFASTSSHAECTIRVRTSASSRSAVTAITASRSAVRRCCARLDACSRSRSSLSSVTGSSVAATGHGDADAPVLGLESTQPILGESDLLGVVRRGHLGATRRLQRELGPGNSQDVAPRVLLAELAHRVDRVRCIATNHQNRRTAATLNQCPRSVPLPRLESARHPPLTMQGTQGDSEHCHVHLGAVLGAQACGKHLDEAHPGSAVYGFTHRSTGDQGRHPIVDQPSHHVGREVRRRRSRVAGRGGCLHDTDRRACAEVRAESKVPSLSGHV